MDIERPLPFDDDAEKRVLGSMMQSSRCVDIVRALLTAEDFYDIRHQLVYKTMLRMANEGMPVDVATVVTELGSANDLENSGGLNYVGNLPDAASTVVNADYYARIVKDDALRREMIFAAHEAVQGGYERSDSTEEYLRETKVKVQAVVDKMSVRDGTKFMPEASALAMEEAFTNVVPAGLVKTCIQKIDEICGGLWPGLTTVLASRPSMGKSTLALNIAINAALTSKRVLFVSLEDPLRSIMWRIMARLGDVDMEKVTQKRCCLDEQDRIRKAMNMFSSFPLSINDTGVMTADEIRSLAMRHNDQHGLDLLIVDHLGHVKHSEKSIYEGTSRAAQTLVQTGKDLDVPLLLLHQLNRDCMKRGDDNFRPKLSDLRQSGEVEQLARQVWLLNRVAYHFPDNENVDENELTLYIEKNSHGKTRKVRLWCDLAKMYVAGDDPNGY